MIVKCTECHASYSVDDAKVENKKFGFSCPKCGTNVIIDNRAKEPVEFPDHGLDDLAIASHEDHVPHDDFADTTLPAEHEVPSGTGVDFAVDDTEFVMDSDTQRPAAKDASSDAGSELDGFDLDGIEDIGAADFEEPVGRKKAAAEESFEITGDDESLTIDDFESTEELSLEAPAETASLSDFSDDDLPLKEEGVRVDISEEDLLNDKEFDELNNLDITDDDFKPLEEDIAKESRAQRPVSDEPTFDDALFETGDTDITEIDLDGRTASPEREPGVSEAEIDVDESITIDLDTLDIQLDETPTPGEAETASATPVSEFSEDIHIETDSTLDSDFDFDAETVSSKDEKELPADIEFDDIDIQAGEGPSKKFTTETDEDQDLTLDLDSLDITLDEIEEFKEGVQVDEDERLTIEDAGLTIDELESVKADFPEEIEGASASFEEDEEDLKLSIDDIDPDLRVEDLAPEIGEGDHEPIIEHITEDQLPEIDFDQLQDEEQHTPTDDTIPPFTVPVSSRRIAKKTDMSSDADYLDIETRERYESALEVDETQIDTVPNGIVNFSIDYSLRYSRIGAILRLLGIYHIALIPHFIILMIYSILSNIVGVFNWLIVLFTGQQVEDFSGVQEKTLRYMLATNACMTNTVEEPPQFTGQKNIDHSLQLNVIYPAKPSKVMAFLRLTGIGIIIVALPHIILFTLLTLGSSIIALTGIISIIAMGSWPNILFDFMVRYYRYAANVLAFMIGLVDKYPSFRFE